MGELIAMFLTGGGSTAMGAILKGVFGMVFESRKQKYDMEMARESRGNENFLKLQEQIANSGQAETASKTRKLLATIGVSSMCASIIMCTIFPSAELVVLSNATGEGRTEILFGLLSWQSPQEPIQITSGHISLMGNLTILPCILGFYFGPSPRR
jgi:hypothetical protein